MKYIILSLILAFELVASVVKSPIVSLDEKNDIITIEIDKIDVGMSGFIVHSITPEHSVILKNVVVTSFDTATKVATLSMSDYDALRNNALPNGRWSVEVGDMVVLAFGYSRGLLISPDVEIYDRIVRSAKHIQWVHPDIFATILSFNGHPTPLREDFTKFSNASSVGVIFIYLNKKVFTIDAKSFKILSITDAQLKQSNTQLPFYTRVQEIDANWWGAGSDPLESYEPHYYKLLTEANPDNELLKKLVNKYNTKASE